MHVFCGVGFWYTAWMQSFWMWVEIWHSDIERPAWLRIVVIVCFLRFNALLSDWMWQWCTYAGCLRLALGAKKGRKASGLFAWSRRVINERCHVLRMFQGVNARNGNEFELCVGHLRESTKLQIRYVFGLIKILRIKIEESCRLATWPESWWEIPWTVWQGQTIDSSKPEQNQKSVLCRPLFFTPVKSLHFAFVLLASSWKIASKL